MTFFSKSALSMSVTLKPLLLEARDQRLFLVGDDLRCLFGRLLHDLAEDLLVFIGKAGPELLRDHRIEMIDDVAGQDDVLLHLEELLGFDRGQRVFLRLDGAVLQRQIDFGKGDRRRIGTAGARHGEIGRNIGHTDLQALHVRALGDRLVRRGLAGAVIADGGNVVAALFLVTGGKPLEDVTLRISDQMFGPRKI